MKEVLRFTRQVCFLSPLFLLLLSCQAHAAAVGNEAHAFGSACTSDKANGADWDTLFQCKNGTWQRAPYFFGTSTDTCDAAHTGIVQWTGSALQVCNGSSWTAIVVGTATVPTGAVMAFNLSSCPSGWSVLSQAAGRVLVGVGQGNTAEGGGLGTNRSLLSTGGAETHTLTIAEMPSHNHGGTTGTESGGSVAYFTNGVVGVQGSGTYTYFGNGAHTHTILPQGGDQPHTIMPPYLGLLYCQKN